MYQDLLKDTAAELERLKAATQAVGDRREKETVSVMVVLFHVVRELDERGAFDGAAVRHMAEMLLLLDIARGNVGFSRFRARYAGSY
jgi:hypothetical protein